MDEELDYDVNEDFQDDEDVNTFYRDENEDEDAKLHEVGSCTKLDVSDDLTSTGTTEERV
jgi:hypothetical protein